MSAAPAPGGGGHSDGGTSKVARTHLQVENDMSLSRNTYSAPCGRVASRYTSFSFTEDTLDANISSLVSSTWPICTKAVGSRLARTPSQPPHQPSSPSTLLPGQPPISSTSSLVYSFTATYRFAAVPHFPTQASRPTSCSLLFFHFFGPY